MWVVGQFDFRRMSLVCLAAYNLGFAQDTDSRLLDNATSRDLQPLIETPIGAFPCNLGKNNPVLSCESKRQPQAESLEIVHEIPWRFLSPSVATLPFAHHEQDGEEKLSKLRISPLPAIVSSIATAIAFEILRARRAAKMGLPSQQLSWTQNMLMLLPLLLLGLLVAIFLSVLESAWRIFIKA